MKRYLNLATIAMAGMFLASSCESKLSPEGSGSKVNGLLMKVNVSEAKAFVMTKALDDEAVPARVFGSDEDDLIITEYVGDMNAMTPLTKGQEMTSTTLGHNINQADESFGVLAYYAYTETPPTQPIASKGLDIVGSCKYSSGWSWDSSTKQYTTTYDGLGHYTNEMKETSPTWWRVKSDERLWSIYPLVAPNRVSTTGSYTDLQNKIDPSVQSSFKFDYTVSTVLEEQKDLLFAYNYEKRSDATNWEKLSPPADGKEWVPSSSFNQNVNIKFYHALAAVKFQINSAAITAGANVHSITICYVDGSGNIVKNVGVARYGECTVTGIDATSSVGFSWDPSKLDTHRPLHYEFADTYATPTPNSSTVAGGYAKNGNGVMFMIPQTIAHTSDGATLKIIVEFSKYGSDEYHTVVKDFTANDITWEAGKYYVYQLSIGEFHVPGENLKLNNVSLPGLKNTAVQKVPADYEDAMSIKGVSKVGLVIDLYQLGAKVGQTVYMHAIINGTDQVAYTMSGNGGNAVTSPSTTKSSFDFDFDSVADDPKPNTNGMVYDFGDNTPDPEGYHNYYSFTERSGTSKGAMTTLNSGKYGPLYYVFETPGDGPKKFQIGFQPAAGDNSGGFDANVRCLVVLEVKEDLNIGNWDDFLNNLSDYL